MREILARVCSFAKQVAMQKMSEGVKVVCKGVTIMNDDEISAGMETEENSDG